MKIKKICKECGKEFEVDMADKIKIFCNRKCYGLYKSTISKGTNNPFFGKHHTADMKTKMSILKKGHKHTKEAKIKMSISRKGKKFTISHRRAISEAHLKNLFSTHKLSSSNKNALRKRFDYKVWRELVFRRDAWTCQECGAISGKGKQVYLEAHHIKSFNDFPKLRYDVSNGITLCRDCHKKENIKQMKGNKNGIKRKG